MTEITDGVPAMAMAGDGGSETTSAGTGANDNVAGAGSMPAAAQAHRLPLSPAMERYILHWGEMGSRWGVNRSIAQIHALLYLWDEPLPADVIAESLYVARSNVSNSLRELQSLGLIERRHVMGDRRDHFSAVTDTWKMLLRIAEARKQREIDPTVEVLRACVAEAAEDSATPPRVLARMEQMLRFVVMLSDWYEQMRALPQKTLLRLLSMGSRIAEFVRT